MTSFSRALLRHLHKKGRRASQEAERRLPQELNYRTGNGRWLDVGFCLLFVPLGVPAAGQAPGPQAPPALSLEQAVATALRRHPSLIRLDEARLAAEAREQSVASGFRPRLTLEAVGKDGPPAAPGFGFAGLANSTNTRNYGADLVLSQIIADFGRTLHRVRSQRLLADSAALDEQAQRSLVALNVYQAFGGALLAGHQVRLAEQTVAARETTVRQAQARFDAGLTSRVDVGLARAALAEAQLALVNASNGRDQAFAELNAAMGMPTGPALYTLVEPSLPPAEAAPPPASPEQDVAAALRQRPELQAIEDQVRAAEESARAARAEGMPLLRGFASGGYDNVAAGEFGQNHTYAAGVGLTLPVYTGGQVQAEADAARHRAAALRASSEETAQSIRLQVIRARQTLTALQEGQRAVEEQVRQAQDSASLAAERYRTGLGSILEVQQSLAALMEAQTANTRLRSDTLTAQAALRYATGALLPPAPAKRK